MPPPQMGRLASYCDYARMQARLNRISAFNGGTEEYSGVWSACKTSTETDFPTAICHSNNGPSLPVASPVCDTPAVDKRQKEQNKPLTYGLPS